MDEESRTFVEEELEETRELYRTASGEFLLEPLCRDVFANAVTTDIRWLKSRGVTGESFYRDELAPSWEDLDREQRACRIERFIELSNQLGAVSGNGSEPEPEVRDLIATVHLKVILLSWAFDRSHGFVDRIFNGPLQLREHLGKTTAAAIALALALPAAAGAAMAGTDQVEGDAIVYAADPGEANRLTITGEPGDVVVFEDTAAAITPGRDCTAITSNGVRCTRARFVIVELEDGDDEAATAGTFAATTPITIDGDQGADTLRGEVGTNSLRGGTGTDRLIGGARTQSIFAVDIVRQGEFGDMPDHNRERDEIQCAEPAADTFRLPTSVDATDVVSGPCGQRSVYLENFVLIEGTEGPDRLLAAGPPSRLFGLGGDDSLDAGPGDRAAGGDGNDRLFGQGLMLGGPGDDRVDAGARSIAPRPRLDGQSGDDRVLGSSSGDNLAGGSGNDVISGRDGNDSIRAYDGRTDRVRCGGGRDTVTVDRADRIASDCERVRRG